tara:strand:+ start:71 stop:484 length:414 start_codon:yes stop_codon:yes gene_type:complete
MTVLSLWLSVALLLSLVTGGFMWWYIRKLLAKFLFISQNLEDLVEMVENYHKHLKHVNNMETYNGDETIGYLLRHTQDLIDMLEEYRDVYGITEPLEIVEENNEDEIADAETKEEEALSQSVSEENVFYAGTRRSNS